LYYSQIKVIINEAVHSEHGKVLKHDFKPGSVERSIDLDKREHASAAAGRQYFQLPPPINSEQFSSGVPLYPILTILKTF
jgi:hypothetical protein